MFFAVVACVDAVFVYKAISTQTGVVTDRPYEKGLAYNKFLEEAKNQPQMEHDIRYDNGTLRFSFGVEGANVKASIIRPVQAGYDFDVELVHVGDGVYQADLNAPLAGAWTAQVGAQWDDKKFQTTHNFIVK